jgi:DNA-binding transcriptional LysR family regulator
MDIAFGGEPAEGSMVGIDFVPIYQGQFLVVARRGHPFFREKITEDVVLSQDFVIFDAPFAALGSGDFPARNSKQPHVTVRASSMQCIETLVLQSDLLGNVA